MTATPPTPRTWNADDYARNSSAQLAWAQELIGKLALQGGETVLDIGCGDGKVSALLAAAVGPGRVLGIDLSAEMIRLARERFPAGQHPNLAFRQMDAAAICLDERFDVAFSSATLHWVADQRAVLRGVRQCLNPGGRLLFQMGGCGNAADVFTALGDVIARPEWRAPFEGFAAPYHFYGAEDYARWLCECGFRPLRVELIPKDMRHAGADGLLGWLRTTWFPYTDRLPAGGRDEFLAAVVEAYLAAHPPDASGGTHVAMVRLEVEALAV
jgi:trans-aconitate 2-methyltransferase